VTNLVLRATYLNSDLLTAEHRSECATVKGFDAQLEIGLKALDKKLHQIKM
jgi:hypothetical protein